MDAGATRDDDRLLELGNAWLDRGGQPAHWSGLVHDWMARAHARRGHFDWADRLYDVMEEIVAVAPPRVRPAWWITLALQYPEYADFSGSLAIIGEEMDGRTMASDVLAYLCRAAAYIYHQRSDRGGARLWSDRAAAAFRRALADEPDPSRRRHFERWLAVTLANSSYAAGREGDTARAQEYLEELTGILSRYPASRIAFNVHWARGWNAFFQGRYEEALDEARACLARMRTQTPAWQAEVGLLQAEAALHLGRHEEAWQAAVDARRAVVLIPNEELLARASAIIRKVESR